MTPTSTILESDVTRLLMSRAPQLRHYLVHKIPARFAGCVTPEDVLQEVWIAAFRGFPALRNDGGDAGLDRWLYTITNRKLLDALKTAQRLKRGAGAAGFRQADVMGSSASKLDRLAQVASGQRTPSGETAAQEATDAIQVALSSLPEDQRFALTQRYVEGATLHEIAANMRRSIEAINGLLFRGMRELRKKMRDAGRFLSDAPSTGIAR